MRSGKFDVPVPWRSSVTFPEILLIKFASYHVRSLHLKTYPPPGPKQRFVLCFGTKTALANFSFPPSIIEPKAVEL
jgi:hypothetical protein